MKYSDFEKNISDQLRGEEVQLDTYLLIEKLNKKQKRKRASWLWLLVPLVSGLLWLGYSLYDQDNTSDGQHLIISETNSSTDKAIESNQYWDNNSPRTLDSDDSSPSQPTLQVGTSPNSAKSTNAQDHLNPALTNARDASRSKPSKSSNLNPTEAIVNNEGLVANTAVEMEIAESEKPSNLTQQAIQTSTIDGRVAGESLVKATDPSSQLAGLSSLPSLMMDIPYDDQVAMTRGIDCPDFRVNKQRIFFEVLAEGGYQFANKSMKSLSSDPNEINLLRSENEASKEGYHAAVYLKAMGRKTPFYLQAGLSTDYITEQMNLSYSYIERDTTVGIISITQSEDGDTITAIYGDIITEREITGLQRKHYRLQTFDVPVLIGYEFPLGRFSLGVDAGVSLNVRMRSTGNILSSPISFDAVDDVQPFKMNIGFSFIGGVQLGYNVYKNHRLYLNLRGRVINEGVNANNNTLLQKYNLVGANLGYGYVF